MATERFYKLPEEKRNRILQAAREELESVPFDELSINKVIQLAGIPRGSFYQYFDDKLDLLGCVIEDFSKPLQQKVEKSLTETNGDLFDLCRIILSEVCDCCMQKDSLKLFGNIFPHLKVYEVQKLFPFLKPQSFTMNENMCAGFDESRRMIFNSPLYKDVPEEKLTDAIELVLALIHYTVNQLFFSVGQKEQICDSFSKKLDIIKAGLLRKE